MDEVTNDRSVWRRWAPFAGVGAAGLLIGGLVAGTLPASADETTPSPSTSSGATAAPNGTLDGTAPDGGYGRPGGPGGTVDESQPQRPDEQLLTGDTASKVTAAALAEYPGATVLRVETDSDGVYEAHLQKADGTRVTVEVDKTFTVTGEESMPARPEVGRGSDSQAPAGSTTPSASA